MKKFNTLIFFLFISLSVSSEEYICSFKIKEVSMNSFQRKGDHFILSGKSEPDLRLNILKETSTFLTLYNTDEIVSFDQTILLYIINKENLTITNWLLGTVFDGEFNSQKGSCLLSNNEKN